jgi:hypothetical protein
MMLTLGFVAAAAVYLARRGWRTWRASRAGCSGGCGCHKAGAARPSNEGLIPAEQLTLRNSAR